MISINRTCLRTSPSWSRKPGSLKARIASPHSRSLALSTHSLNSALQIDKGRLSGRSLSAVGKTHSRNSLRCQASAASLGGNLNPVLGDFSEGLETPVQAIYLVTLLGFLVVGAYLVVRQVLIRRELEDAAKSLGDRIRSGNASSEETFELGVILLRKKLFTQAVKNLEKARKSWDGEPDELAQVHNALGFAYYSMEKPALAIDNYKKAVEMQPGYVTAWNNLGNAFEKARDWKQAYDAYTEALSYAPDNRIARERSDSLRGRAQTSA